LYAVRDPRGFRPLVLGKLPAANGGSETWLVASETCAFDLLNAQYVREIEPGEMVRISRSGIESIRFAPEKPHQQCIFEHVYFSRPDSIIFGRSVNESREALGRLLALEHPADADIVVPVPDSGVPAAVGYALESKIPFRMGLIRNHYMGRTFIEPSQAIRNFGVKLKLNPVRGLIEGKRIVLVDDSIVRGTTSRKIVRMVREAGAREVHVRISCPPTISPCYYGVDTPTKEELIASSNTPEEICRFLGADSLGYLSMTGLKQAVSDTQGKFCTSCYTGVYPTDLVQLEVREGGANGKSGEGKNGKAIDTVTPERPVVVEHEG
jgi:amidophosphoribosyltransferase